MDSSSSTDDRTDDRAVHPIEHRICFAPHINAIIGAARSHFHRPVDAIAEFIDNAIQACRDTPQPEIRICVFLSNSSSAGFFLILDNGSGMNIRTIQEFAMYSLDPKARNIEPTCDDKTFFAKFGVGAKQAGFFLGSRIKLFTKPANDDVEDAILTFCLDAEELIGRNDDIHYGVVREIDIKQPIELREDERRFPVVEKILREHFRTVPHGSAFLVKLREDTIIPELKTMPQDVLQNQIKDIYHFHLHPEHCPENIGSAIGSRDNNQQRSVGAHVNLTYELYWPNLRGEKCNLRDESDFIHQCVKNAVDIFPFSMHAPLPGSEVNCSINGFFLYFPCKDGEETTPIMDGEDNQHNIHIYWQNRLIPHENRLSELFFFPSKKDGSGDKIGRNWRERIVGFLFFRWEFDRIANNKLRFLIHLHDWLNTKVNTSQILTFPANVKSTFQQWLVNCHKADREFIFADRIRNLDSQRQTFFESLTFEHNNVKIKKGDRIKIKPSHNNDLVVYGEVLVFVVNETIPQLEINYFGASFVRYKRLPRQMYGEKVEESTITKINPQDAFVTKKEMMALENAHPITADVYLFGDNSNRRMLMNDRVTDFLMGVTYNKIGIQIKSANGDLVFNPLGPNKPRYNISVEGLDERSPRSRLVCTVRNVNTGENIGSNQILDGESNDCFYCVDNITLTQPGPMSFLVNVHSPFLNHPLFQQEVRCRVVTMPPERVDIIEKDLFVQLGQPFPSFHVQFLDRLGQCVPPPEDEVEVEIESELMDVIHPMLSRKVAFDNKEVLLFRQGELKAAPKRGVALFNEETVEREVEFSLSIKDKELLFIPPARFKVKFSCVLPSKLAMSETQTKQEISKNGEVNHPLDSQRSRDVLHSGSECGVLHNTVPENTFQSSSDSFAIKIMRGNEELPASITCTAGSILSNLSFTVYHEGDAIDEALLPLETDSWMECDWTPHRYRKRTKHVINHDLSVPSIEIPECVSASPLECALTVSIGNQKLKTCLSVDIIPREPFKWSLVCSPNLETCGIRTVDVGDLQKNICGAVWIDEFGNLLPCNEHSSCHSSALCPFLEVFVLDKMHSESFQRIPMQMGQVEVSAKQQRRSYLGSLLEGFILPSSASLELPPECDEVVLRVVDEASHLKASEPLRCRISSLKK